MIRPKMSPEFISDSEIHSQDDVNDVDRPVIPSVHPQSVVSEVLTLTSNPTSLTRPKQKRSDAKEKSAVSKPGICLLFHGPLDTCNLFSASIDITFDVTVFSIAEMKKPAKQCGDGT